MQPADATVAPRRGQNRRGELTRADLVAAGWRLVERMTVSQLFGDLTATEVAREAGRTTGAFFHHFPSFEEFVDAMVDSYAETVDRDRLEQAMRRSTEIEDGVANTMRQLAKEAWQASLDQPSQQAELLRFLLISAVGDRSRRADGTTQADVVQRVAWEERLDAMEPTFGALWSTLGREPIEPFDHRSAALAMVAMLLGFRLAHQVGVEVDPAVVAELSPALALAMSRPIDTERARDSLDASLEPPGRSARPFQVGTPGADEVLRAVRRAAKAGGTDLRMATVAAATGMSLTDAMATFGTTRRAVALTARLDVPAIRAAAWRFLEEDPARALADSLVALVRAARDWGPVALALLGERCSEPTTLAESLPGGDISDAVPLGEVLAGPLSRTRRYSSCEACTDDAELAVDLVVQTSLSRPRLAPAEVAEIVLCALRLGSERDGVG